MLCYVSFHFVLFHLPFHSIPQFAAKSCFCSDKPDSRKLFNVAFPLRCMPSSPSTQLADNETMQCATEIESEGERQREREQCNLHCLLIVAARIDIKLRNVARRESKGFHHHHCQFVPSIDKSKHRLQFKNSHVPYAIMLKFELCKADNIMHHYLYKITPRLRTS